MVLSLGGLPQDDIQKMLGTNALDAYDLDADAMWRIAANIGPRKDVFVKQAAE
jgi:hypothetical protein